MITLPYSRHRFDEATERILLEEAVAAEGAGRLTDAQLGIIRDAGWFRMFVPQSSGGLQLTLPLALKIEEALSAIDGSLGWTVTLCSGAGLFAGFVSQELRAQLFAGAGLCIGGSGMASGTAERVEDGYLVNGDWSYATGAPHLTAFSANCHILENGRAVLNDPGEGIIRSFMFLPEEVHWREDWQTMGLKATASHSFSVSQLFVPEARSFVIQPEAATSRDPIYQYPFLQFAELTLAANFGGMALSFLDGFDKLTAGRNDGRNGLRREKLDDAGTRLSRLLRGFHRTADASWELMTNEGRISPERLLDISAASRKLAAGAREIVAGLYPYAGLAAADPSMRMNRILRDMFTATQHALLNYPL